MRKAQARGALVWSAPWTPPAAWKDNHSPFAGHLSREHFEDYANQMADYVVRLKREGIELYAISVQNEPDGAGNYESCQWSGQDFHDFIPVLYRALEKNGVASTRIMIPENIHWGSATDLYQKCLSDTNIEPMVGIIAVHNYDGRNPESGAAFPPSKLFTDGKPLWQTEVSTTGKYDGSMFNAIYLAVRIQQFLAQAGIAWH